MSDYDEEFSRDNEKHLDFNLPSSCMIGSRPPKAHLNRLTQITGILDSGEFLTDRTMIELAMLLHWADKLEIDVAPRVMLTIIKLMTVDQVLHLLGPARGGALLVKYWLPSIPRTPETEHLFEDYSDDKELLHRAEDARYHERKAHERAWQ